MLFVVTCVPIRAIYLLGVLCGRGECPTTSDYDFNFEVVHIFLFLIFTSLFFYLLALYVLMHMMLLYWLSGRASILHRMISAVTLTPCCPSNLAYLRSHGSSLTLSSNFAATGKRKLEQSIVFSPFFLSLGSHSIDVWS